ncbi:UDP-2,3-diacylglucosamine diphosphatase LpxI [Brevundimonas sp. 2R-24]|uniref:UDP-2,3-diacylglucosamine diphosphatase LpxI n=1 Tax=Peiella sedimenti TaxID=3061083 RepID=A0ABT8SN90_9CAUL|nr:UDP-2,3-diacylglucosamine diphosphatase LpxI [Caulobacteraceae bacterium XZ-24]
MSEPGRLGLVSGGGDLPGAVLRACEAAGRPVFIVALKGFTEPDLRADAGVEVGLAEFGKCIAALQKAGCRQVCFCGNVSRPDFASLVPDLKGMSVLPGLIAAGRQGDDALLRAMLKVFEDAGFEVVGPDALLGRVLEPGALGGVIPDKAQLEDVTKALDVARATGALDIGQGAVVAEGLVLAVEAQEGTDAMLRRVAGLPQALRGQAGARKGALAKAPKPIQERRVDLPVIGVRTVELAAEAGLAGVAGEAGGLIVVDADAVRAAADRLGLFVWGEAPSPG